MHCVRERTNKSSAVDREQVEGWPRGTTMSRTNQREAANSNPRHTEGGTSYERKDVGGQALVESSFHAAREATARDDGARQKPNIYEGAWMLPSSKRTHLIYRTEPFHRVVDLAVVELVVLKSMDFFVERE